MENYILNLPLNAKVIIDLLENATSEEKVLFCEHFPNNIDNTSYKEDGKLKLFGRSWLIDEQRKNEIEYQSQIKVINDFFRESSSEEKRAFCVQYLIAHDPNLMKNKIPHTTLRSRKIKLRGKNFTGIFIS